MCSSEGKVDITLGFKRGTCKWTLISSDLIREDILQSLFEIGGCKWKLVLSLENRSSSEATLVISLVSCNPSPVKADVDISIHSERRGKISVKGKEENKACCPFDTIEKCTIPLHRPANSLEELMYFGKLCVTADLNNVEKSDPQRSQPKCKHDATTIHLEVLGCNSIKAYLKETNEHRNKPRFIESHGVVSPDPRRDDCVHSCCLINAWSEHRPDYLYWVCKRCANGTLLVQRCLNDFDVFETFGSLCAEQKGTFPTVTLFAVEKGQCEDLEPVDRKIVTFCKLFDPSYGDMSYVGYTFAERNMGCQDLLESLAEMAQLSFSEKYTAFLEGSDFIKDITREWAPLIECGFHSGASVILRKQGPGPDTSFQKAGQTVSDCVKEHTEPKSDEHHNLQCHPVFARLEEHNEENSHRQASPGQSNAGSSARSDEGRTRAPGGRRFPSIRVRESLAFLTCMFLSWLEESK